VVYKVFQATDRLMIMISVTIIKVHSHRFKPYRSYVTDFSGSRLILPLVV